MENVTPSIMSHVSIGTNRFAEAVAFYDRALEVPGAHPLSQHD